MPHQIIGCPLRHEGCLARREEEALGVKRRCVRVFLTFCGPSEEAAQLACARHLEACHGKDLTLALAIAANQAVFAHNDPASSDSGDDSCQLIKASSAEEEPLESEQPQPSSAAAARSGRSSNSSHLTRSEDLEWEEQQESEESPAAAAEREEGEERAQQLEWARRVTARKKRLLTARFRAGGARSRTPRIRACVQRLGRTGRRARLRPRDTVSGDWCGDLITSRSQRHQQSC